MSTIFGPCLMSPNAWMIKTLLGTEVSLGPDNTVLDGDPALPFPWKGAQPTIFGTCLLWPNGCINQDSTWYGGRLQPRWHCVRWGPSSPSLKGHSPQFSANVHCSQTAGWTKMPLGMEVGLSPGDFVFDRDPALSRKKGTAPHPIFGHVCCGQTAGWMKTPLGTEVDLGPGHIVLDGDPAPLWKGHSSLPFSFRPMSFVATVTHLSYCWALVGKCFVAFFVPRLRLYGTLSIVIVITYWVALLEQHIYLCHNYSSIPKNIWQKDKLFSSVYNKHSFSYKY